MKKGLSDVVTTVLIILFAIVAVAIIGGIVLNQVNKAGTKISTTSACSDISVEPTRCSNSMAVLPNSANGASPGAYVVVQRSSAGSAVRITNVTALFEKTDGTIDATYISNIASVSQPLSSTKIFSRASLDDIKTVGLAVEITNADGSKTSCDYYKNVKRNCFKGDKIPLLGYWPFDVSGNYNDYSGNGNNLVPTSNAPTFSNSPTGRGGYLTFDPGNPPTDKSLTNAGFTWPTTYSQVTVSFWANVPDAGARLIFGVGNPAIAEKRFEVYPAYPISENDNKLLWDYGNADVNGRYSMTHTSSYYNNWKHIVLVSDGSSVKKAYVNGVDAGGTTTPADSPNVALTGLFIGKGRINSLDYLFKGSLDEFMIYNQTLSADEIMNIYNYQRAKFGV